MGYGGSFRDETSRVTSLLSKGPVMLLLQYSSPSATILSAKLNARAGALATHPILQLPYQTWPLVLFPAYSVVD